MLIRTPEISTQEVITFAQQVADRFNASEYLKKTVRNSPKQAIAPYSQKILDTLKKLDEPYKTTEAARVAQASPANLGVKLLKNQVPVDTVVLRPDYGY